MVWASVGLIGLFLVLGWTAKRRHAHDPLVMPYRTGHVGLLGKALAGIHHRMGARRP